MSMDDDMRAFLYSVASGEYVFDPADPNRAEAADRALNAEPPLVEGWHLWHEPRRLSLTPAGYKAIGLAPPSRTRWLLAGVLGIVVIFGAYEALAKAVF